MKAEIAALYDAFADRSMCPSGPAACISCCATSEAMARLAAAPRDQILFDDLLEYHDAAKGPEAETMEDLLYVLPRTMEFLAGGKEPKTAGAEMLFSHYLPEDGSAMTAAETAAVDRFLEVLVRERLSASDGRGWPPVIVLYQMAVSGGLPFAAVARAIGDPPRTGEAVWELCGLVLNSTNCWQQATGFYEVSESRAVAAAACLRDALASDGVLSVLAWGALGGVEEEDAARASTAHQVVEHLRASPG